MKGIKGLIVALGLGIAGTMFNWTYLARKSQDVEKIDFIGIASEATVGQGERLLEKNLVPIGVPKHHVGNLDDFAVRYSDRQTVVGMNVWRPLFGGSLLLRKHPLGDIEIANDALEADHASDTQLCCPATILVVDVMDHYLVIRQQVAKARGVVFRRCFSIKGNFQRFGNGKDELFVVILSFFDYDRELPQIGPNCGNVSLGHLGP